MRGRALFLVSVGLVVLTVIGFVAVLGVLHDARTDGAVTDGMLVADVRTLRQGDVLSLEAPLPGAQHKPVRVFVVHPHGREVRALLGVSTHLGCRLMWVGDTHYQRFTTARGVTFEDPCGGSTFALDGSWCGGPAPRAMDRFRSTVVDGELAVDLHRIVRSPRRQITSTGRCSS